MRNMTAEKTAYMVKLMGNDQFDLDAFRQSETFQQIAQGLENYFSESDEMSETVVSFWRKKGLIKELHDVDRYGHKWASYLPVSALEDKARTYPLLFVLHGANNPIFLAESYGYTDIAAQDEMIVLIPENESAEETDRLFAWARENAPVDWSRVYMVGYSLGGIMTGRHALRWPERFAGVGVGGMMFACGGLQNYRHQDVDWPGELITEEMLCRAEALRMPICNCMGENEFIHLLPLYAQPAGQVTGSPQDNTAQAAGVSAADNDALQNQPAAEAVQDAVPLSLQIFTAKNKLQSINNWRRINGCACVDADQIPAMVSNSDDAAVRMIGFPFEKTLVIRKEERNHYVGDCIAPDGSHLARFVGIEKSPHWPSRALCEITWAHISRFARDPQTGVLIERADQ